MLMADERPDEPRLERRWRMRFTPYTAEQMFAIAAGIEDYPRFVPGCVATRILARSDERHWLVDNVFGFGPMRARFTSQAELDPPRHLRIVSTDGGFWSRFQLDWRLGVEEGGCTVDADVAIAWRSPLLATMAAVAAPRIEPRILRAFETRARDLYG